MNRIREKLKGKKRVRIEEENENDDDLKEIIDEQRESEKKAELYVLFNFLSYYLNILF